jgi:hypothetical protein
MPSGHSHTGVLRAPVGQETVQRSRLQHGAGQGMRAQCGGLFQYTDAGVRLELFQTDGKRQPRRPGADDQIVVLHLFTLGHGKSKWLKH